MHFRIFNGFTFILLFPGPVRLDLGDAIPRVVYVPTVSSLLSIISDVMKEYSTRMVRKWKYRRYLDIYSVMGMGILWESLLGTPELSV